MNIKDRIIRWLGGVTPGEHMRYVDEAKVGSWRAATAAAKDEIDTLRQLCIDAQDNVAKYRKAAAEHVDPRNMFRLGAPKFDMRCDFAKDPRTLATLRIQLRTLGINHVFPAFYMERPNDFREVYLLSVEHLAREMGHAVEEEVRRAAAEAVKTLPTK